MAKNINPQTFIFIGRSGCGKGTQAKILIDYLKKLDSSRDSLYIQSGLEFREFIKGDTTTQKFSRSIYDKGALQPEFLAVFMWVNVLINKYTAGEHLIFDGTPRRYHEAGALDSIIDFYKLGKPNVLNIEISREESIKRLLARGRMDDKKEEVEERLSWFETEVLPAISFYKDNPRYNYILINGEQSEEKIHKDIVSRLAL